MKNVIQINKHPSLKMVVINCLLMVFLTFAGDAIAQDKDPASLVYRLYKDYAWEAIFYSSNDVKKHLGNRLVLQSKDELSKYFDDDLLLLLMGESDCVRKNVGELCRLEFNPIFSSQDPMVSDLTIKPVGLKKVEVTYKYPSNNQKITINYLMKQTKSGWLISDIEYVMYNTSLKKILGPNVAK
ncbi:MAG: hypothetical protein AB3X41_06510 [Leptothrix ochracea]|uniref:hypothetical protein n=1 Tax=Leptothrix ochracea TaxID=735331 RepID=UPI0034E1D7C8